VFRVVSHGFCGVRLWESLVRGKELAMETLFQDLHYSLRQLARSPRFTVTAVISLALGIGATTAVFSVIYAALMDPFPYPTADRIVRLTVSSKADPRTWVDYTGTQVMQLRQSPVLDGVLAMDYHPMTLTGPEFPENVNEIGIISTGFNDLGVAPLLGRGIAPSDAVDGKDPQPVTVLSFKFWQKHYFGDPTVLGKTLQLNRKNYTVVGVAAPRATWYSADVYLPLKLTNDVNDRLMVNVLLKPGVSESAADAALEPLLEQFSKDNPRQFPEHFKVQVEGLNAWVVKQMGKTLYLLMGAVALLLAIGCGNVSILLLARGAARQHELAVRSALGAKRRRIVRQLLTESLLLSGVGAACGVAMAYGILAGIKLVLPQYAFAPEVVIRINLPVLAFSVAMALATGVAFGLWPALKLSRPQISQMAQAGTRRVAGSVHGRRTQDALIAGQIALTLLLLAAAGSAIDAFTRLLHAPLGYDPHNIISVGLPIHEGSYTTWATREAYFKQLQDTVAQTPGVTMTAISSNATPPRNGWYTKFEIMGKTAMEQQLASVNLVDPNYFSVLHIPLLQGRLWDQTENHDGALLAVINRTMAQRYFPNGDAIGHSLKVPGSEDQPPVELTPPNFKDAWLIIVGIVEDARNDGLENPVRPAIYLPFTLHMSMGTQVLVKSHVAPLTLVHSVREQLKALNPEQQMYSSVEDLETWISDEPAWQQERLVSWIFSAFAVLALALAAAGLYSVVSYSVAQRTNEFGIRMALGAQRTHIIRIVFASALVSVGSGIVAGLALTFASNRLIAQWAQGNVRDPMILLEGTLVLVVVAAVACVLPARRASSVEPMTALRCE
jgi:predicted permease